MDFSALWPTQASTLSNDTMGHAQKVEACRWGWSVDPNAAGVPPRGPAPTPYSMRANRFAACRGRLYHQLTCSHRIRTDIVEDCGPSCLDPHGTVSSVPFFCQECLEQEAKSIWRTREEQHNALHPPLNHMTKEQFDLWYSERRKLEDSFTRDRKIYEMERKANTRPSNICSSLQVSEEEKEFAAELDSLSLAMMSSSDSTIPETWSPARNRVSLPNDASEQIHWGLNSLAIDRGSCGVEYSASQPSNGVSPMQVTSEEELWGCPRPRN